MGLLSLSIWTPIVFGGLLLAFGRDEHAKAVRWLALMGALISPARTLKSAPSMPAATTTTG